MDLDFLEGGPQAAESQPIDAPAPEPQAPAPQTEQPADPKPAPQDGPARGPDGKFAPKDAVPAEAAPAVEAVAQQVQSQSADDDRYGRLEAQVQGLTKALTEARQQRREASQPPPDPYEDPEGYQAWSHEAQTTERADWSRKLASAQHGAEMMDKVQEWAAARAATDQIFQQQTWTHPDPYGFAIEEYRKHQALSMLSDPKTLERFQAFMTGTAPAPGLATPQAAPAALQQPVAPPRSITSVASAGGASHTPQGPGASFMGAIQ